MNQIDALIARFPLKSKKAGASPLADPRPWQVIRGPEWNLRVFLSATEARVRALGGVLLVVGLAVLATRGSEFHSTPPVFERWAAHRGTATIAVLLLALVGGVGLIFLQSWARWALLPLLAIGAIASTHWTYRTLDWDQSTPELISASTPEGREAVVRRGALWIAASALPALLVGRRRSLVVCSSDYRFAVARTPRPYPWWWVAAWFAAFLTLAALFAWTDQALSWRMPTDTIRYD